MSIKRLKITEKQAKSLGLIKENKKIKLKITQEQYNKLIKENTNLTSVDAEFKKQAPVSKSIMNLNDVNESDGTPFDIKKPNDSIHMKQNFGKPMMEEIDSNIIKELIQFLYGKMEYPIVLDEKGVSADKLCLNLLKKGLIIPDGENYKISKSLGNLENVFHVLKVEIDKIKPELETEAIGGDMTRDMYSAPDDEPEYRGKDIKSPFDIIGMNDEIAILKSGDKLFAFIYWDYLDRINLFNQSFNQTNIENVDIDKELLLNFIGDAYSSGSNDLEITQGMGGYEDAKFIDSKDIVEIIQIDGELRQELIDIYGENSEIGRALNTINEEVTPEIVKTAMKDAFTKKTTQKTTPNAIKDALNKKREEELKRRKETGEIDETSLGGSSGVFQSNGSNNFPVAPLGSTIKRTIANVPETVNEVNTGDASGQYTAPAFKMKKNHTDFADVKTKAQETPLYAGGSFVEQPECSKLNNNKEAQNGGCLSGPTSLKLKKAKGSIVSPSLGENQIHEKIAEITGRNIMEVKKIIQDKIK